MTSLGELRPQCAGACHGEGGDVRPASLLARRVHPAVVLMAEKCPRWSLRLLHTSDLHLGCDYLADLPRRAIRRVVDVARDLDVNALLLPGDVFDHNRVAEGELAWLLDELARFPKPSVILPGNHDCFDEDSVYRRQEFATRPARVHLLDGSEEHLLLPDLDLAIWGRPVIDHCREFRPLVGVPSTWQASWRVVMGHGQFELPNTRDPRSSPIFPDDIASANCDYVALGHWDNCTDVSQGGVVAFYSGAPHHGSQRRGLAEVLLVTFDPAAGVSTERLSLT